VNELPFVATRTGDRPSSVTIADPANVAVSSATKSPTPAVSGPVLNGAYRFDYDNAHQTVNGDPIAGGNKETHWFAFRSSCTSTRCVAPGASLSDNNQQESAGAAIVLEFTDGRWQNAPTLQVATTCDAEYSGGGSVGNGAGDTTTKFFSLQPQPDGTLSGVSTTTVLTNECGFKGSVFKTPLVVTRIGDVPPAVILADPALF
jgi:serine/threonine-protein kinase